jgi:ABC-type multidrug transport system fused ATPase/permease subunit
MKLPLSAYWRLLRRYLAAQRGVVLWMAALLAADIGLQLVGPQVVRAFIEAAQAGATGDALIGAGILFLAVSLAQQGATVGAVYWGERVAWTATNALRLDLAAHLLRLDPTYHQARTPGELIERVDGDVNVLARFFSNLAIELAGNVLLFAGIVVAVALVDARLGLAFALFGGATLATFGWVRRRGTPHWEADRQRSALFYGYLGEVLAAKEDLRACGARRYAIRRMFEHLRGWLPVNVRAEKWGYATWAVGTGLPAVAQALTYGLGGTLYQAGALSLGTAYSVVAYAAMLGAPIAGMGDQIGTLQRASASIARVRELLAVRPGIEDGTLSLPPGALPVALSGVCFAYQSDHAEVVLEDLSFELEAGRVLGLLGRTGSGKTTIARLLYRLYDPQQGEVCLGGVNLRQAKLDALRERVGYVPQDVQLLQGSLRDNLTFYTARNAGDDERLRALLEKLGLGGWLARLPDGLDTQLSGSTLSAGEAQLVALARVFLKDPGLVILDEASSRLDPATEALLERALDRLLEGRSAVIIAHRLATVARADEIVILEAGRVVERGPRAELALAHSAYAGLLRTGLEEVLA